jgi:hypothetical protein
LSQSLSLLSQVSLAGPIEPTHEDPHAPEMHDWIPDTHFSYARATSSVFSCSAAAVLINNSIAILISQSIANFGSGITVWITCASCPITKNTISVPTLFTQFPKPPQVTALVRPSSMILSQSSSIALQVSLRGSLEQALQLPKEQVLKEPLQ